MNKESESALPLLTGKLSLNDVAADDLQQLADAHPYFAAAQLLLAQKMKQENNAGLPDQLHKTALYFPNSLWLRYLLSENKEQTTEAKDAVYEQPEAVINNENADQEIISDSQEQQKEITETITEPEESGKEIEDENLITIPAEQILEEFPDANNITSEPEEMPLDDDELQQQSEAFPIDESNQKIASLLSGQAEQYSKPVAEDDRLPVAAEPFHTVDYFASQGIKLDAKREENQLDKKVHKFTDWLRQMKRINPQPSDLGTETEEETVAANIADSSNYTKAVLTESMADVLLKQGKRDKAIEIYQKLSLLNPDKSTYFAALIQNIK